MNYEEKKQARIERYEARAERADAESDSRLATAHKMASRIPFGQPILVGHHSERRDRNYRAKIDNNFRKSIEAQKKAEYWKGRAAAAASNHAISSDDENAIQKLEAKLAKAEKRQEQMKATNKIILRKPKGQPTPAKIAELNKLMGLEPGSGTAEKFFEPDFCGRIGFASYQLSNNNANIRRMRARLAELKRAAEMETTSKQYDGFELVENVEENRIQFLFDGKPPAEVRQVLKSHRFRWARSQGAWQRHLNGNGRYAAECVIKELQADAA